MAVGLGLVLIRPAGALHQIAGHDLGPAGEVDVEFVPAAAVHPTTAATPSTTPATTSQATQPATAGAPSATQTTSSRATERAAATRPGRLGLGLGENGQWLLPPVAVPSGTDTAVEDLLWFRFQGSDFGRSRDWDGRVELVAFDAGGPRVAVRCSSTRPDGTVAYHDGHEWRQTGALLRSGVDYLIRTVLRPAEGRADIYLLEPGGRRPSIEPTADAPTAMRPNDRTTQPSTHSSTRPGVLTRSGPHAITPLLTTGREVLIAGGARSAAFERTTVRRVLRISGRPMFATIIRRWQLWDVTRPGRAAMVRTGRHDAVVLAAIDAVRTTGGLRLRRSGSGQCAASFPPQVGLHDDLRSGVGWTGRAGDRIVTEQGGPALAVRGLGALGDHVGRPFFPPRVPFDLTVVFKLSPETPPMRTIDLVRLIRKDTRTTIGPYVQLLAGMHDLGNGRWAGRLAAQVGQPQPVVDGNPIHLDTWYELGLKVDPITGVYTAALTALGKDRPSKLYAPATRPASAPTTDKSGKPAAAAPAKKAPPAKKPAPKPVPVFGGKPQKFFGLSRLPNEMALLFEAEGAYRSLGRPVDMDVRPSFVLPAPDKARPWTDPAMMTDMTYRDGKLEILNSHDGGSLLTIDLADGTLEFVVKAFGPRAGQAVAWDQAVGCYWWVQPTGRFLLERRWPESRDVSMFLPNVTTRPAYPFQIVPAPDQVVIDGKLDEWDRNGACGPLTDDEAQIGKRDCIFYAMYDANHLYLAADVHDPDPLINVAVPAGKKFTTGDVVTFRFCADPARGAPSHAVTQPKPSSGVACLHFWHNHQQKKDYVVLTTAVPGTQPTTGSAARTPKDVRMKMTPWPDKDPRGKGYTLETACPWRSLPELVSAEPGRQVGFTCSLVWGDPSGSKAVASVTAFGQAGPNREADRWGRAVFARRDKPVPQRSNQVVGLHANGRLTATGKDLFFVTWEKGIYRVEGKAGEPVEFDYRKGFNPQLRFAGVSADDEVLLLAGPYGAPNAATILAVNLASGRPIRRFSLRRYVKGVTSLARDGKRLYALAATDRLILSCDWPGRRLLGLTSPTLLVGRIDAVPAGASERLDLITAAGPMPKWAGSISKAKDAGTGTEHFAVKQATLQWPTPTLVVGDTLGEFRAMRLGLRPAGPAQAVRITLHPKPVGRPRSAYVAVLDEKSASHWPLSERGTTAKAFFTGGAYVRDAKSPLRQFKPTGDDEPVFILPAGAGSTELRLDMVEDFGLAVDTWIGQVALQSIGPPVQIEHLSAEAGETVHAGPAEGMLVGDVIDLEHVGYELLDWHSDVTPAQREGDELTLWIRSANDRTELAHLDWYTPSAVSTAGQPPTSRPLASQPLAATQPPPTQPPASGPRPDRVQLPIRLGRYVQWRLGLRSIHIHEPPSVSTVRLMLAGGPQLATAAVATAGGPSWRTWWPVIFAAPVACYLIWFAFLRRRPRADEPDGESDRVVRKGRFRRTP